MRGHTYAQWPQRVDGETVWIAAHGSDHYTVRGGDRSFIGTVDGMARSDTVFLVGYMGDDKQGHTTTILKKRPEAVAALVRMVRGR